MKLHIINVVICAIVTLSCQAKMIRNKALMTKMLTNFQKDNHLSTEPELTKQKPEKVLVLMQNVLCRNFPTIPCDIITNDQTLSKLIERSIQQISYKKMTNGRTTRPPGLTLFPIVNSEDLSNFLQVRDAGIFNKEKKKHKKVRTVKEIDMKPQEYTKKIKRKETKRTAVYNGRKKLRKFYPHKVKHKERGRKEFRDYSDEKLSMSVEDPEMPGKRQHFSYKVDPETSVWRIDYTKHGEPSLNVVYDQGTKAKNGINVFVDDTDQRQNIRKDVMHPDLYIKKKFAKKNIMDLHSEGID